MAGQIKKAAVSCIVVLAVSALYAESAMEIAARTQAEIDSGSGPVWMSPQLPEDIQNRVQKKSQQLTQYLKLGNESKEIRVAALLAEHYGRVWACHQQTGEKLEAAWSDWEDARNPQHGQKDELKALTIMVEQIDPIYAQFVPQIHGLLKALRQELSEEQIIVLLDLITRSPGVERTYNAYVEMVPEMKDQEKRIIRERLEQARVDSLAAWTEKHIVRIFKKYKIRNEFSIDYFGYGYRQRYEAWVNRKK